MIQSPNPQQSQYEISPPPHIRSANSVDRIMLNWVISLFPVLIVSLIGFGWHAAKIFLFAVPSAAAAEISAAVIFNKKFSFHDGSGLLTSILTVLLLPVSTPAWIIIITVFFAVWIAKDFFGGLGQNPFSAPATGVLFLFFGFPVMLQIFDAAFAQSLAAAWHMKHLSTAQSIVPLFYFKGSFLCESSLAALAAGGVYLVIAKNIDWELPLIYMGAGTVLSLMLPAVPVQRFIFSGPVWISAFYLITDYSSTPLSRRGMRLSAVLTAVLTVLLMASTGYFYSSVMSVFILSMVTPWIDTWTKTKPTRIFNYE